MVHSGAAADTKGLLRSGKLHVCVWLQGNVQLGWCCCLAGFKAGPVVVLPGVTSSAEPFGPTYRLSTCLDWLWEGASQPGGQNYGV